MCYREWCRRTFGSAVWIWLARSPTAQADKDELLEEAEDVDTKKKKPRWQKAESAEEEKKN